MANSGLGTTITFETTVLTLDVESFGNLPGNTANKIEYKSIASQNINAIAGSISPGELKATCIWSYASYKAAMDAVEEQTKR